LVDPIVRVPLVELEEFEGEKVIPVKVGVGEGEGVAEELVVELVVEFVELGAGEVGGPMCSEIP